MGVFRADQNIQGGFGRGWEMRPSKSTARVTSNRGVLFGQQGRAVLPLPSEQMREE